MQEQALTMIGSGQQHTSPEDVNRLCQVKFSFASTPPATDASSDQSGSGSSARKSILKRGSSFPYSTMRSEMKQLKPPYGPPFVPSQPYLLECSLNALDDIVTSWNFGGSGCCVWHCAVSRLEGLVTELRHMHSCADGWSPRAAHWQCGNCTSLITDAGAQDCWLCGEDAPSTGHPA